MSTISGGKKIFNSRAAPQTKSQNLWAWDKAGVLCKAPQLIPLCSHGENDGSGRTVLFLQFSLYSSGYISLELAIYSSVIIC